MKIQKIYEDQDIFVINKPAGLLTHPASGKVEDSISGIFEKQIESGVGQEGRAGIVHRLDKDTSGLLILAKTQRGYDYLIKLFKGRKIRKRYMALVYGRPKHPEGVIDSPIGRNLKTRNKMDVVGEDFGKNAITRYKVVDEFTVKDIGVLCLIEAEIESGRTHQIRVHMKAIGHPVVGDTLYGPKKLNFNFGKRFGLKRQFLHAAELEFESVDKKKLNLKAELAEDLKGILTKLSF
ncbi:MAG: RluA family pseudouridine synthase [Candidatus Gracilibacteria bacterium]